MVLMPAGAARALVGAAALLALSGAPQPLEGQVAGLPDRTQTPAQIRVLPLGNSVVGGGWLGIRVRYEVTETSARPTGFGLEAVNRTHRVRVEEVLPDGPARVAGMAPGDRILRIDGMDAGQAIEAGILSGVRPGQVVRFGIEREGRALQLRVLVAPRPAAESRATAAALARVTTDSIVSHMLLQIDSARASVARETLALRVSPRFPAEPQPPAARRPLVASRSGFPVDSTFLMREEATAARSSAVTLRTLISGRSQDQAQAARAAAGVSGPILVYATGQRAVLGAEVTPVNPGLASYFGVDTGLLVTQVVEGAPGARGGLAPGDVIIRVGPDPVSTVAEFRAAAEAGFRSPPLVLGVVREGRRLELRIPR